MSMTIQSSVKDKILATPSETSKVENAPAEMLRDLDQQMEKRADDGCTLWIKLYSKYEYEIRYHPGKANVVIDALRRKERVKPRRVRAMAMTIQYGVRGMILAAQSEAFKQENGMMRTVVMDEAHASRYLVHPGADKTYYNLGDMYCLRYLSENEIESPWILSVNFQGQSSEYDVIWVMEWNSGDDQLRFRWMIYLVVLEDAAESVSDAIRFEYCLASSSGWTKSPVIWAKIGGSSLIGPELVQETTDKEVLIKEKLKTELEIISLLDLVQDLILMPGLITLQIHSLNPLRFDLCNFQNDMDKKAIEREKNEDAEYSKPEVCVLSVSDFVMRNERGRRRETGRANSNAVKPSCELLRLFVTEAVQRAATIAEAEGGSKIEATHLERILPQLLFDF
ncbi:putative reverse transcriptase domain-containing protein [Tanacetum coccineum]